MEQSVDATAQAVVPVLSCVLNQLCKRNDTLQVDPKHISKFHALRAPAISVEQYLMRIAKYGACSGECFVLALIYIDRIIQSNPNFVVNSLNIHRLLITSVMLGAKYFDDQYYNNSYYAKVGGVPPTEINSLEVEFLFMCNFTLFVSSDTYQQYYHELYSHAHQGTCSCSAMQLPSLIIPPHVYDKVAYDRGAARQEMEARHRVIERRAFEEDARQRALAQQHDAGAPMSAMCVPGAPYPGAAHPGGAHAPLPAAAFVSAVAAAVAAEEQADAFRRAQQAAIAAQTQLQMQQQFPPQFQEQRQGAAGAGADDQQMHAAAAAAAATYVPAGTSPPVGVRM